MIRWTRLAIQSACAWLVLATSSSLVIANEISVAQVIRIALESSSVPRSTKSLDIRATYVQKGARPTIEARGMNIDFLQKHSYWVVEIAIGEKKDRKGKIVRCIDSETGNKLL